MLITDVLVEILQYFESGKKVKAIVKFGTLNGYFIVDAIQPHERGDQWIFSGDNFNLSTGRYNFLEKEQNDSSIRYIFSPKLVRHPKKTICFEIEHN